MITALLLLQDLTRDEYLESLRALRESRVNIVVADLEPGTALGLLQAAIGINVGAPEDLDFTVSFDAQDEPALDLLRRVFGEHGLYVACNTEGNWRLRRSPAGEGPAEIAERGGEWIELDGDARAESETFLRDLVQGYIERGYDAFIERLAPSLHDLGSGEEIPREEIEARLAERPAVDLTGLAVDDLIDVNASAFLDSASLDGTELGARAGLQEGDRIIIGAPMVRTLEGTQIFDNTLSLVIRNIDGEWRVIAAD